MSLTNLSEGHHLTGGRRPAGAQAIPYQKPEPHQFQKIHEIQSPGVYPQRKGHFETGERPHSQHQGRGRKEFRRFLGQGRAAILFCPHRLHLV